jgi:hypothetical protein
MKPLLVVIFSVLLHIHAKGQSNTFVIDSSKFNKPVMIVLDSLYNADQAPRLAYLKARNNKAGASTIDSLKNIMHQQDQENLKMANTIIAKYGWLGPQKVGMNASQALFLIIQHADLSTQIRYLPLIRTAEKKDEIESSNLAILEDRINVRKGKKQAYGSQGFIDKKSGNMYICPISDPDQLDKRRKSMGMIPMSEYVKSMHIDWNLDAYKKMLPELEKMVTEQKP